MDKATYIKMIVGTLSGIVSTLFGRLDAMLYGLFFCIAADYVTGICAAVYEKRLNSRTGFHGILKKIVILTIVSLSHVLGYIVGIPSLRDLVIGFYIANESLSILENATKMNIKYTGKLKEILEQLKE